MELPVEMITHIMKFFEDQRDIFSASLVSRAWYAASRDPCLRSEVDVAITISPSMQLLTEVINLNQTKVVRLHIDIVSGNSAYGEKRGHIQPSVKVPAGPCRCDNNTEQSTNTSRKATLFGITFETLVLPRNHSVANLFDLCVDLIKKSCNLQSLELTEHLLRIFKEQDQTRLKSALYNITQIHFEYLDINTASNLGVSSFPRLQTIIIGMLTTTTIRDFENLWSLCDNSASHLKIRIHWAVVHFQLSEELKDFLCKERIQICHFSLFGADLTVEKLSWLENISHNVQDLCLQRQPNLEMLEFIRSKLSTTLNKLEFPYDASDITDVLSILSQVRNLVFKGPRFELKLQEQHRRSSSRIHLTLKIKQEILEPTVEILSSIIKSQPLLASDIRMHAYVDEGSHEVINEALSTFDGIKYLTVEWKAMGALCLAKSSKLSQLRSLRITFHPLCDNLNADAVLRLPMPQLQDLNLPGTHLSNEGLRSLATYAFDLRRVNVADCSRITDEGMRAVLTNCKRLERLCLHGCESLTHMCMTYIAEHGISIRYLDIHPLDNYYNRAKELLSEFLSV